MQGHQPRQVSLNKLKTPFTKSRASASGSRSSSSNSRQRKKYNKMSSMVAAFYPHPITHCFDAHTYRDQRLRAFSAAIRNKPNWTFKVTDRSILANWFREAERCDNEYYAQHLMWDSDDIRFMWKELNNYRDCVEKLRSQGCLVEPDTDGVWRADGVISEELRNELINAIATLENVPDNQKDWHPGSDQQVLDLVHPSLWPVVYGRTISLVDGRTIVAPQNADPENVIENGYSAQFCWLPSEFEISTDGKETRIVSYINNLSSPQRRELFYPILEKIFTQFVPLFNHVLEDLGRNYQGFQRAPYEGLGSHYAYISEDLHTVKWEEIISQFEKGEDPTVRFSDFAGEICWNHESCGPDCKRPNVYGKVFKVHDDPKLDLKRVWTAPNISKNNRLEGRTVKVIVKLANIMLPPENSNERIVSTGIYYYEQDNITDSGLAFRARFGLMEEDHEWVAIHNLSNDGHTTQECGSIQTKEHRLIAFPNMLQHQVQPFELVDGTKPGYRKILVFFLCDPSEPHDVPTTRTVAPQQPEERSNLIDQLRKSPLGKLPEEVFQLIIHDLPLVISRQEAEEYREKLMEERSSFNGESEAVQGYEYSFCEH